MRIVQMLYVILFTFISIIRQSDQHGALIEPPSRNSAWMVDDDFQDCCKNYDYNELNCGGTKRQWEDNGGQCGICGEAWDEPKIYTKGGDKYLGKIMRTYDVGTFIDVHIRLTANHKGVFEFRICNLDTIENDASQDCLNKTILKIKNTEKTQYKLDNEMNHKYSLELPYDLSCNHCVLQWKWIAAKDWGTDNNGKSCMGCGLIQETTYNCADISIKRKSLETIIGQKLSLEKTTPSKFVKDEIKKDEVVYNNKCTTKLKFGTKLNFGSIMDIFCQTKCNSKCRNLLKLLEENLMNDVKTVPTLDLIVCMDTCPIVCNC